jgi:type IV pilus assembly protein PilN
MIRINLLPHREQKKAQHRLRFQAMLFGALGMAGLLVLLAYLVLNARISHQEARNQYLQNAITVLDQQIRNIESLRKERNDLLARKQLVERLQQSRGDATRVFEQLLRRTPDGVYLKSFQQTGNTFSLSGYAISGPHVSLFMRNLAASEVFDAPVLVEVASAIVNNQRVNAFTLNLSTKQPPQPNPPAAKQGGKP